MIFKINNKISNINKSFWKFPGGLEVRPPGNVAAVVRVTTVAQVQSLAWELPHATGMT